jgi:hypothetical protein
MELTRAYGNVRPPQELDGDREWGRDGTLGRVLRVFRGSEIDPLFAKFLVGRHRPPNIFP